MDLTTITALSNALDFGAARMQAISNNLSNINTPGYHRKDASFEAMLTSAQSDDFSVGLQQNDPRDMAIDQSSSGTNPAIITAGGGAMRLDGNNVDIDSETSRMAATEIYYQGAAQLLEGQFSALHGVISG